MQKIIITVGPSTLKKKNLSKIKKLNFINLFRINLSHTKINNFEKIIKFFVKNNLTPICVDTEGAQVRTTTVKKKISLKKNKIVKISFNKNKSSSKIINLYPRFDSNYLLNNTLMDVGFEGLKLKIIKKKGNIFGKVLQSGYLDSNKGVHFSNKIKLEPLTDKDKQAIQIAKKYKIKYFALSFANDSKGVKDLRKLVGNNKFIISKIETKYGYLNREGIIRESNAILIDRGDLSRYINVSKIPIAQKKIIETSNRMRKPTYVATNLLESMINSKEPTRAESNDIYNSLYDGAKGLVLAAETAIGKNPVLTIKFLKECIDAFNKYKKTKSEDFLF